MAWHTEMVPILRVLINDYGDENTAQVYSQTRLEEILLVAAMYVQQENDFGVTYTIKFIPASISPDPVDTGDTAFTNFTVMKAACLADQGTFRTKAIAAGISAKCGPVSLNTISHLDGFKELLTVGPCAAYEAMKKDYMFGNGSICRAILSPFNSNNFDPESLGVNGGNNFYDRGIVFNQ